jgi:hypothetical protein
MINLAPIALFCFKRLDTLKSCIESLKMCSESINTDLIIFSDTARNEGESQKVNEVRHYLTQITGFKTIRIIYREENYGVDYNIIRGIQQMSQEYDSFIIVEDDLVVSNQFLRFMNAGLEHFISFEKVLTLSAFNYVKIPKKYIWDCYFAQRSNPWGWATWSYKIKNVEWDLALTNNFLSNPVEMKDFNVWGSDRSRMLQRTLKNEIRAWDIRLDYYQFKNNFFTAFTSKNLVINNGFNSEDASNTIGYNRFKVCLENFNLIDFHFPNFLPSNPIIKRRFITKNSIFNRFTTIFFKKMKIKN